MEPTPADIGNILTLLAQTPLRLAEASKGLEKAQLHFKPAEEAWSANDILAHLRACADVWGKSMLKMIEQNHPTIRYVSPRTWIRRTNYTELEFDRSFEAFTNQRNELLQTLKAMKDEDWSRGATFTATTRGREQTVFSYALRLAEHETGHCEQIEALLRSKYGTIPGTAAENVTYSPLRNPPVRNL
jgi:hypothetical protein